MSKITSAFRSGKAFIPFVTCGDPSLEVTEEIVYAMADAGADLIELGIPFSDPTAEGPVIQEANVRALSAGTTTDKIFDMVRGRLRNFHARAGSKDGRPVGRRDRRLGNRQALCKVRKRLRPAR